MRIFFNAAGTVGLVCWVLFYLWVQGMGCAFTLSGNCRAKWPWELSHTEDLMLLVVLPGGFVAFMFYLAWQLGRAKRTEAAAGKDT